MSCDHVQEVGEHAHCGRGILPASGFSYDPETFMAADVGVYNFSWKDMGVPTLFKMMDIVQVQLLRTSVSNCKAKISTVACLLQQFLAACCRCCCCKAHLRLLPHAHNCTPELFWHVCAVYMPAWWFAPVHKLDLSCRALTF